MKSTAIAIIALTVMGGAAFAQPYGSPPPGGPPPSDRAAGWDHDHHDDGPDIDQRLQWVQNRINEARNEHRLDRREFYRVQAALNDVRRDEWRMKRFHHGHLDGEARARLAARLDSINDQIRWSHDDGDHHDRMGDHHDQMGDHHDQRPW